MQSAKLKLEGKKERAYDDGRAKTRPDREGDKRLFRSTRHDRRRRGRGQKGGDTAEGEKILAWYLWDACALEGERSPQKIKN